MNSRQQLIRELRRNLEAGENPRLYMALLIAITGMIGFIASFILLHFGMHTLWLRYLVAGSLAYLGFLAMLYEWTHRRTADGLDLSGFIPSHHNPEAAPAGEALGQIHESGHLPLAAEAGPLYLLVILLVLIASCVWVITSAPELLAEMLLDSAVVASVYRRLRHRDRRSWIGTALRGTARPFLFVLLVLMAVGWLAQQSHPEAVTLGQALRPTLTAIAGITVMNPPPDPLTPAARIAIAALTLLGLVGGWMILLTGGFTHTHGRDPHNITVVDGAMAFAMAALDFAMTAIGAAALVQAHGGGQREYLFGCGLVLVPPVLFTLLYR